MSKSDFQQLRDRAHRWAGWAAGIRAATEFDSAKPYIEGFFPLVDTSEIIEYARPSSLLRNEYPNRLDLAINLLFAHRASVYVSGPHARELQGIRAVWHEHLNQALETLKLMRAHFNELPDVKIVKEGLLRFRRDGIREKTEQLVRLLRENYRWIFSASQIPPNRFDSLIARLCIPSAKQLGLPPDWQYQPNRERAADWQKRLHDTGLGRREPGPNLIDAYALDQLEEIAKHRANKVLPILLTHSGKILEALKRMREKKDPNFFRIHGVSLVQPPELILVQRVRDDAMKQGNATVINEELARQQARGETIAELLASKKTTEIAGSYETLDNEIEEFERSWQQWDALRQVLTTLEEKDKSPSLGMLEGLDAILRETSGADAAELKQQIQAALDQLIGQVGQLQGDLASRIAPPATPTGGLSLHPFVHDEIATVVVRFQTKQRVPSAAYPLTAFRFRDPAMIAELEKMDAAVTEARQAKGSNRAEEHLHEMWRALQARLLDANERSVESYLLFSDLYLAQERWWQAYDMARAGITTLSHSGGEAELVMTELLLARAGAGRAFVHAERMDFPGMCEAYLQKAMDDCLLALETQNRLGEEKADPRVLRELAVILCSAHDPVYGPSPKRTSVILAIDADRVTPWIGNDVELDPLYVAGAFARKAYENCVKNVSTTVLFLNTHLYAMTEIDRRLIDANDTPRYEQERSDLATDLMTRRPDDPNFLDTLMWHALVTAISPRVPPLGTADEAVRLARQYADGLDKQPKLGETEYYHRLIQYHQARVRKKTATQST
ncbi:MAG: hypothetical protein M3P06_11225 [Acidobacteriota bacterium]|nr:hypothetical protein [Acidobacteriota bacterium]